MKVVEGMRATPASDRLRVGIVGGSGYTGALLAELLLARDDVELCAVSSASLVGRPLRAELPRLRTELAFCAHEQVRGVEAAFVCLPHARSAPVVRRLLDEGARVVDLSADFRLTRAEYEEWYGEHPCPELLPGVYGLPELYREAIAGAELVANPGCYPTAALLALAPLRTLGLVDVVVDAKSGVSGAGKAPSAATHFCAVDSDLVPYALGGHRHYPEIASRLEGRGRVPTLTFVPHLAPLQRGIVATVYAQVEDPPSAAELRRRYEERYAGERFVTLAERPPQLADVRGTNDCRIYPSLDARSGRIVVVAVIDNLMKGASGQALQNMNLMFSLPEARGLE
jgi:N-acetyl-gamma-glutamyl-phosphate reductase